MAKYLKNDVGKIREEQPITISAGAADASKIAQLDLTGKYDISVLPVGVGVATFVLPAFENLAAGDKVNIFSDSGTAKVRKASAASTPKEAHGFVLAAVTAGNNATVYTSDENTQLTGLTVGADYYLSATTAGGITSTAPSGSNQMVQYVGTAISATTIQFFRGTPIYLSA